MSEAEKKLKLFDEMLSTMPNKKDGVYMILEDVRQEWQEKVNKEHQTQHNNQVKNNNHQNSHFKAF